MVLISTQSYWAYHKMPDDSLFILASGDSNQKNHIISKKQVY